MRPGRTVRGAEAIVAKIKDELRSARSDWPGGIHASRDRVGSNTPSRIRQAIW